MRDNFSLRNYFSLRTLRRAITRGINSASKAKTIKPAGPTLRKNGWLAVVVLVAVIAPGVSVSEGAGWTVLAAREVGVFVPYRSSNRFGDAVIFDNSSVGEGVGDTGVGQGVRVGGMGVGV